MDRFESKLWDKKGVADWGWGVRWREEAYSSYVFGCFSHSTAVLCIELLQSYQGAGGRYCHSIYLLSTYNIYYIPVQMYGF